LISFFVVLFVAFELDERLGIAAQAGNFRAFDGAAAKAHREFFLRHFRQFVQIQFGNAGTRREASLFR
jgi:hypothetical protein